MEHADFFRYNFDLDGSDKEKVDQEPKQRRRRVRRSSSKEKEDTPKKERKRRVRAPKKSKANKKLDPIDEKVKEEINKKKDEIREKERELKANKEEVKRKERELRKQELELRKQEKAELRKLKMANKKRMLTNQEIDSIKLLLTSLDKEIKSLKSEIKNAGASPSKEIIMTDLDRRYVTKNEMQSNRYASSVTGGNVAFVRELLNRGFVNVYFDVNQTEIQSGSISAVNYLKEFLTDNPYFKATLIGYADESGSMQANQRLSEKRAKAVFDILVDAGVNPTRLTYEGAGVDSSVGEKARQLARRVTFRIDQ